jgi:PAS domain-containing protein
MRCPPLSTLTGYGYAIILVALATVGRRALDPVLGDGFPFATLFLAVLIVACYGGLGPSLLATVLGALASACFLLPPREGLVVQGAENQAGLVLFVTLSLGITVLGGAMRNARRRAEEEAAEALAQEERFRDVTGRRRDEEIRRLNHKQQERVRELETLLDILPVGVWQGDPACERITGNRTAYDMLGLPRGLNASVTAPEVRAGESPGFRCLVDGREVPPEELPMQRAARTGRPVLNYEHDVALDGGPVKTVCCNVAPVVDEEGKVRAVLGAYADVTERKRAEAALVGQNRVLEMVATDAPLAAVLARLCEVIEQQDTGLLGSVLLLDQGGGHIRVGAGPSLPEEYLASLDGLPIAPPYFGPCGLALDAGQAVVVDDADADGRWSAPWRELALRHGLRALRRGRGRRLGSPPRSSG